MAKIGTWDSTLILVLFLPLLFIAILDIFDMEIMLGLRDGITEGGGNGTLNQ